MRLVKVKNIHLQTQSDLTDKLKCSKKEFKRAEIPKMTRFKENNDFKTRSPKTYFMVPIQIGVDSVGELISGHN